MAELMQPNGGARRLRERLAGTEPIVAPGAYDGLSARLAEQAGFPAVYMTGFGASASLLAARTWGCCHSARWPITPAASCRRSRFP